jgi:alcohol dehydrogenase (NADP+)
MRNSQSVKSHGYAAHDAQSPLVPFHFDRRTPRPGDVVIDIAFCGICHSDIHQVRNEWGMSLYPMVPGHEIVGKVSAVGSDVTRFKVGDLAGVGCMVDSCRTCPNCVAGEEQYCDNQVILTYNSKDKEGNLTFGGYSNDIVVDEAFVLKISPKLDLAATAPLLCAGITTYSPLRHWGVDAGMKVGVVGLGGLGHMGLKFAHAFGAHVVQFTTSAGKSDDAKRLGADEVVVTRNPEEVAKHANSFDFILDTVSAEHDLNQLANLLKLDGTLCLVGAPEKALPVHAFSIVPKRRSIAGSMIGGIAETQEMLDFCAEHDIVSDIEMTTFDQLPSAFDRVVKSDVKYRFVIDIQSLKA